MRRSKIREDLFYRSFEISSRVNQQDRSVELSFSSEEPVKRWFGDEILLHGRDNVDLSRLKQMGAGLLNHNPNMIIGRIVSPSIKDKRGQAKLVFDDDEDGNKAMAKVESGSLRGVSVGYQIYKFRDVLDDEEYKGIKGPAMVAIKWAPYEVSLTPIPADSTVGVGRDLTRSLDGIDIERQQKTTEVKEMEREEILQMIQEALEKFGSEQRVPDTAEIVTRVLTQIAEDAKPKIRVAGDEYLNLMARAAAISPEAKIKVADMIGEGKDAREVTNELLNMLTADPDADDKGDGGDPPKGQQRTGPINSFKQVDDDSFFRSLGYPGPLSLQ